jgi:hypothetical protein
MSSEKIVKQSTKKTYTNSQAKRFVKAVIEANFYNSKKYNKVPLTVNVVGTHGI